MAVRVTDGSLSWTATIDDSELNRIADRMEARFTRLGKKVKDEGSAIEDFAKKAAAAAAGYLSLQGATGFISSIVRVRGEFQQLEVAFRTMLKSKSAADQLLKEAVDLAATTPFGLQDVASGAKQLLAYGTQAKDITKTLEMLGNVASGVSAPLGDIVYLYGTLQTQGRAYTKDIQQFTGRGIPIIKELAAQFKVTEGEVLALVEAGKVGFPEVQKAFQAMTSSSGLFFNLMKEQSKTLTGQLSNLSDAWDKMLNTIGQQNEGLLNSSIQTALLLVEHYQDILDILTVLIATYGAYRTAVILTAALSVTAAEATAGVTLALKAQYLWLIIVERTQKILNATMLANPYVAVATAIAALGSAYYVLSKEVDSAVKAQNSVNKAIDEGKESVTAETLKIQDNVRALNDNNAALSVKKRAVEDLRKMMPEHLKAYTDEEVLAGKATEAIKKYNDALVSSAVSKALFDNRVKAEVEKLKFQNMKLDDEDNGFGLNEIILKNESFNEFKARKIKEQDEIIKALADAEKKQNDKIAADNASAPVQKTIYNKKYYEDQVADIQSQIDKLNRADSKFSSDKAVLMKKLGEARKDLAAFDTTGKQNSKDLDQAKRYSDMIEKIYDLNSKYNNKTLTDDQRKLQEVRDEYKDLRREIDEFNKDPKNKKINVNLKPQEEKALQNQTYENETSKLQIELERQKKLYAEFEAYRTSFGEKKAIERYQKEIDVSKTYLEVLKDNTTKTINDGVTLGQTGPVKSRLLFLTKELKDTQVVTDNAYQEGIKALISYEQQRTVIIQNYERQRATMIKNGDSVATLDLEQKEALEKLDQENLQKLDAYKGLFAGIEGLSRDAAQKVVANAKTMLDALKGKIAKGEIKVDPEFLRAIEEALKKANDAIDDSPQKLQDMAGELGNIAGLVSEIDAGMGQWLGTISNVLGNVGKIKADFKALQDAQEDGDALGGLTAGLGIFGAGIGIIKSITSLFDKSAQREEQAKYERDLQLKQTEAVTKALDRQLALIKEVYGEERLVKFSKGLLDIQDAIAETTGKLGGMFTLTGDKTIDKYIEKLNAGEGIQFGFGNILKDLIDEGAITKVSGDLEDLQKLLDSGKLDASSAAMVQSLINLDKQYKETLNSMKAETTGTSFESITDSIVDMFKAGTVAAEDFGKNFEQIMQQSILNSFKRNSLEKELQVFYDKFADYSSSAGSLTEIEISELRSMYDTIIKNGQVRFEELEKLTGIKFGSDDQNPQNSLEGSIKANMTEETGTRVAGAFNGMLVTLNFIKEDFRLFKVTSIERLDIAKKNLDQVTQIAESSKSIVSNTNRLEVIEKSLISIEKKMDSPGNALAANGVI